MTLPSVLPLPFFPPSFPSLTPFPPTSSSSSPSFPSLLLPPSFPSPSPPSFLPPSFPPFQISNPQHQRRREGSEVDPRADLAQDQGKYISVVFLWARLSCKKFLLGVTLSVIPSCLNGPLMGLSSAN